VSKNGAPGSGRDFAFLWFTASRLLHFLARQAALSRYTARLPLSSRCRLLLTLRAALTSLTHARARQRIRKHCLARYRAWRLGRSSLLLLPRTPGGIARWHCSIAQRK
jgi:hypothetical protein